MKIVKLDTPRPMLRISDMDPGMVFQIGQRPNIRATYFMRVKTYNEEETFNLVNLFSGILNYKEKGTLVTPLPNAALTVDYCEDKT